MRTKLKLIPTIILLCITVPMYGQKKVTLQLRNYPIEKAFRVISDSSGFGYLFDPHCLEDVDNVTISCANTPLQEVLMRICESRHLTFVIKDGAFTIRERLINVSGIIVNEQGQTLTGVVIQVRHKDKSTISNSNGTFYLKKVSRKDTLIFTAPGMKTEVVPLNGASIIPIQLKYDGLPPVTVLLNTGFQRMPISLATGSIGVVNKEMLAIRTTRSIDNALEGSLSGLNTVANKTAGINQPRYFQVGARATLNGDPDPLVILDQFPYNGDLSDLNNDDIESVVILKDASVASIWGARGANGVVVITTKKAKYADPLKISFNNYVTVGSKPDLFYPDALGPNDRIDIDTFLFNNNYTVPFERRTSYIPLTPVEELLIANRNGKISPEQFQAALTARRNHDARNDELKSFYRRPATSHLWTDMTYGNHQFNFRAAIGFDEGRPIVQNSKDNRRTGSFNLNARVIPKILEISGSLNGTRQEQQNTGDVPILPAIYEPLTDQDGNALSQPFQYREHYLDSIVKKFGLLDWRYYPKTEFDLRDQTLTNENLRGQVNVSLKAPEKFIKGLELLFSNQYQLSNSELRNLQHQQSYEVRDLVNKFTLITPAGLDHAVQWGNILDLSKTKRETYNTRWQLSYQQNWPNFSQLSLMAGVDRMRTKESFSASRTYGYSAANPEGQSIDYNKDYILTNPAPAVKRIPQATPAWNSNKILISYFSSAGFNYKKQLNVSVTGRLDYSNVFGLVKNQNSIPLFGTGISWDLHNAPWYHLSNILPELTVRTTYGTLGNIAGSATLFPTVTPAGFNFYGDRMSLVSNPPLNALKWEKMKILNIGLNFKFPNNVIAGSIDYFNKRSSDLLDEMAIDPTTGDVSVQGNSAKMRATQLDIVLNARILKRRLGWNSRLLFSMINETVTACSNPPREAWEYCEFGNVRAIPGHAPYDIYSFTYQGLDKEGNPVGIMNGKESKDYGKIITENGYENLVHNGRGIPGIYGSLLNEFVWQQFNLTTLFLYEFKFYYRRHSIYYKETFAGTGLGSRDFENRWKKTGDEQSTNVPKMIQTDDNFRDLFYKYSQVLVERGDNIRLQLVNLSYALNPKWVTKLRLNACSVYINANNLGIIWRAGNKEIDPRQINGLPNRPEFSFGIRGTIK